MGYDTSVQNIYGGNGASASSALTEGGGFYYSLNRDIDEGPISELSSKVGGSIFIDSLDC